MQSYPIPVKVNTSVYLNYHLRDGRHPSPYERPLGDASVTELVNDTEWSGENWSCSPAAYELGHAFAMQLSTSAPLQLCKQQYRLP